MNTKAQFRATREMVGLTQADVAEDLKVSIQSVKRWEREDMTNYSVPESALRYINDQKADFVNTVTRLYNSYFELIESNIVDIDALPLTYCRDQSMHDDWTREPARFGTANAIARAVATMLEIDGYHVEWSYPSD